MVLTLQPQRSKQIHSRFTNPNKSWFDKLVRKYIDKYATKDIPAFFVGGGGRKTATTLFFPGKKNYKGVKKNIL